MTERLSDEKWLKRNDRELRAADFLQPYTLHHAAMFSFHPDLLEQVIRDALSCRLGWKARQRVEWAARTLRAKMAREGKTKETPDDDKRNEGGRRGRVRGHRADTARRVAD